jgi:hypothetical protein
MHRDGSGKKIEDLDAARQQWRQEGKSPSTYCNRGEFATFQEDLGELVAAHPDGCELRKHATLKVECRGGSPKVVHNRVVIGYHARPGDGKSWWNFWPISELERLTRLFHDGYKG